MERGNFRTLLRQKGQELFRPMPWREDLDPYAILVSEIMLQQTQVARVQVKFAEWMARFPTLASVAQADFSEVLAAWNGLGYNRRAQFLHRSAKIIIEKHGGIIPRTLLELQSLPGVGANTAGAILAYAYNEPAIFIETNIRAVYMHHFFPRAEKVHDNEIKKVLEKTLDTKHPRDFYWALMDYGAWLKVEKMVENQRSVQYKKQPKLEGSVRQVRGEIVRALTEAGGALEMEELQKRVHYDERFALARRGLKKDGMIRCSQGVVCLGAA